MDVNIIEVNMIGIKEDIKKGVLDGNITLSVYSLKLFSSLKINDLKC
tara:strand:- start:9 stop:149 length:141 start_codon:yes stop_codon:yes gene_type:complete